MMWPALVTSLALPDDATLAPVTSEVRAVLGVLTPVEQLPPKIIPRSA
jgi:hypothetical protein